MCLNVVNFCGHIPDVESDKILAEKCTYGRGRGRSSSGITAVFTGLKKNAGNVKKYFCTVPLPANGFFAAYM